MTLMLLKTFEVKICLALTLGFKHLTALKVEEKAFQVYDLQILIEHMKNDSLVILYNFKTRER